LVNEKLERINENLLESFSAVECQMTEMGLELCNLKAKCNEMNSTYKKALKNTLPILDKTRNLKYKSVQYEVHQQILMSFSSTFCLSEREIHVLQGIDSINPEFFSAMNRIDQILQNCKALLEADDQKSGLEVMQQATLYQDQAFDRLFKWTQLECRLMKTECPEISSNFRLAMQAFRLKPILFE
jgi:hypothetical protein